MAEPGHAHPVGARVVDGGVNFSVFSENASAVDLLLFESADDPLPSEGDSARGATCISGTPSSRARSRGDLRVSGERRERWPAPF